MKNNKQNGFSLIELSMVIAVIALLTIGANLAFTSIRNNQDLNETINFLTIHMVTAVQQCQNRRGDLEGCDKDAIIALSPITGLVTPWGDDSTKAGDGSWSVTLPDKREPGNNRATGEREQYALALSYSIKRMPPSFSESGVGDDIVIKLNKIAGVSAKYREGEIWVNYSPRR